MQISGDAHSNAVTNLVSVPDRSCSGILHIDYYDNDYEQPINHRYRTAVSYNINYSTIATNLLEFNNVRAISWGLRILFRAPVQRYCW